LANSNFGNAPGGPSRTGLATPGGRTGTEEYHSAPLPLAQEAAALYAANHIEAAEALLKAEIRSPGGRSTRQPWLMLFDLYEVTRNRAEFEALAPLYQVRFDQPAPGWPEGGESAEDPRRARDREHRDYLALTPDAMGDLGPGIEGLAAFAQASGSIRMDFGAVASITANESALLAGTLQRLRRAGTPMWFNNAEILERALRTARNERASEVTRSFWLLLFELYVLQGRREPFEELGLEYAVAFEAEPPGWQVYVNSVSAAAPVRAPAPPPEAEIFLKGVVSAASQDQLAELAQNAAAHAEVVIDMGKVLRVDFSVCAIFHEAVKSIQLAGKRIILADLSELNAVLLEAFGFNRHAILMRRKAN
jgi:anti-anti-sigma regulatory factor